MKIPNSVKILGQAYRVIWKKNLRDMGLTDVNKNVIYLRSGMVPDKAGEVFCHEVTHAITEMLNQGMSEDQVNNTAVGWYAFLKDNNYI